MTSNDKPDIVKVSDFVGYTCPFCNEYDFDLYGLQLHLIVYCTVFRRVTEDNKIPELEADNDHPTHP